MKLFASGIWLVILAAMALTSCGGGGGTSNQEGGVYIVGGVNMTSSKNSGTAYVYNDNFGGTPIADATVTVNSQPLTYNTVYKYYYVDSVLPDGGKFTLTVTANGATLTTTVDAYTSMPVLTVPSPFNAADPIQINWTAPGGAPAPSSTMTYNPVIVNYAALSRVYAPVTVVALNDTVPANTLNAGTQYIANLYGTHHGAPIANAATGSYFNMWAHADQVIFTTAP